MSTLTTRPPSPPLGQRVRERLRAALDAWRAAAAARAERRERARRYAALRALDARTLRDIGAPPWVGDDVRERAIDRLRGLK